MLPIKFQFIWLRGFRGEDLMRKVSRRQVMAKRATSGAVFDKCLHQEQYDMTSLSYHDTIEAYIRSSMIQ
jgi:hypothetical protein